MLQHADARKRRAAVQHPLAWGAPFCGGPIRLNMPKSASDVTTKFQDGRPITICSSTMVHFDSRSKKHQSTAFWRKLSSRAYILTRGIYSWPASTCYCVKSLAFCTDRLPHPVTWLGRLCGSIQLTTWSRPVDSERGWMGVELYGKWEKHAQRGQIWLRCCRQRSAMFEGRIGSALHCHCTKTKPASSVPCVVLVHVIIIIIIMYFSVWRHHYTHIATVGNACRQVSTLCPGSASIRRRKRSTRTARAKMDRRQMTEENSL